MEERIRKFHRFLIDDRQMAENTCLAYKRDLTHMAKWLSWNHVNEPSEVNAKTLESYIAYLECKGKSPATVARTIVSIKAFYNYLGGNNPAAGLVTPKIEKKEKRSVSRQEADFRLSNIEGERDKAIRDRAMLSLMYSAGLKASEVTNLKVSDIDLVSCFVKISKGNKQRFLDFDKTSREAIIDYLDNVRSGMVASDYTKELFVNCDGRPLSRQGLWKIINNYK